MAGTILVSVQSSKLLYATILKAVALWEQIRFRRQMLTDMLPDIATQWDAFKKTVTPCISRKVAVTASLSKAETVPDETRVPASVEINAGTARLMYGLAGTLGLSLNSADYQWFDPDSQFREAIQNFAAIANIFTEIEQLAADLTMHRAYGADLYSEQTEQRTPGQLAFYSECDIPLCDGIFAANLNRAGLRAGFGDLYLGWMMASTDDLVAEAPPAIESVQLNVSAGPVADPDDPSGHTLYAFAVPAPEQAQGFKLAGVVIAARPSLSAPVQFYLPMTYTSETDGCLRLSGIYTDPSMPPAIEFRLLLLKSA